MVGKMTLKVTPGSDKCFTVLAPDQALMDMRFGRVGDDVVGFVDPNTMASANIEVPPLEDITISATESPQVVTTGAEWIDPV